VPFPKDISFQAIAEGTTMIRDDHIPLFAMPDFDDALCRLSNLLARGRLRPARAAPTKASCAGAAPLRPSHQATAGDGPGAARGRACRDRDDALEERGVTAPGSVPAATAPARAGAAQRTLSEAASQSARDRTPAGDEHARTGDGSLSARLLPPQRAGCNPRGDREPDRRLACLKEKGRLLSRPLRSVWAYCPVRAVPSAEG
jgi:hypothetical protein